MRKSKQILEEVMEFEKIKKIISEVLNVDAEEITMDTTFVDDLGDRKSVV